MSITAIPDAESGSSRSSPPPVSREAQSQPNSKKSPSQLRIRAQGALLSLAPHKILYGELVGEGINPTVLEQLYDEVGIKVRTPQSKSAPADAPATKPLPHPGSSSRTEGEVDNAKERRSPGNLPAVPTVSPQQNTGKPLERKDVIARMLAAKAGKTSEVPQRPKENVETGAVVGNPPTITIDGTSGTTHLNEVVEKEDATHVQDNLSSAANTDESTAQSNEVAEKENERRVREKNKAQTELARQRIELLKKQGLTRSQQNRQQSDAAPQNASQKNVDSSQAAPAPAPSANHGAIRHPLPSRPPIPDPLVPSRIPGLFMTEQVPSQEETVKPQQSSAQQTPAQQLPALSNTSKPTVNHRKRPRASDFDDVGFLPRGPPGRETESSAANDRLIIDISDDDDDGLYGSDRADAMDIDSSADEILEVVRSEVLRGNKSPQPPSVKASDAQSLRQKDLAIQAMRRRIAEMEERKKSKSAPVNAEPNGHLTDNGKSTIEPSVEIEGNASDSSHTRPKDVSKRLADMSSAELENMRLKLQEKEDIISSLTRLDSELKKCDFELSEIRDQEKFLSSQLEKAKQGRSLAVGHLEHLEVETRGVSLEELETAQRALQSKEKSLEETGEGMCNVAFRGMN